MDGRPTWTDCDEAGDYVVPNVLSPRDLVSRPDNMDKTVPHIRKYFGRQALIEILFTSFFCMAQVLKMHIAGLWEGIMLTGLCC